MNRQPKRGDFFIHARFLADGARSPYDTDDKFSIQVVTAVRRVGSSTVIYHTDAESWLKGDHKGAWYFDMAKENESVRRWL